MAFSFRDIAHCFPATSEQVETGLFVVKRTATLLKQYVSAVRGSSTLSTLKSLEPESISALTKMQEDRMLTYRNTALLLPKVLMRIHEIQDEFAVHVNNQIINPLLEFWESSVKQLKAIVGVEKTVTEKMNQTKTQLHNDREKCLRLLEELKMAEKNMKEAPVEKKGAADNALIAFQKAQSLAHEAFVNYNKFVVSANKHQKQYHEIEMPIVMDDLEKIEKKRLSVLREKLAQYIKLHNELAESIRDLVRSMNSMTSVLSESSDVQLFVAHVIDNHGSAEKPSDFEVKLPFSPEQILEVGKDDKGIALWQHNSSANECGLCKKPFTFVLRKHHCRSCGALVCSLCSSHKATVAAFTQPVRVCDTCHTKPPSSHPKVKIAIPTAHTATTALSSPTAFSSGSLGSSGSSDSVFAGPTVLVKALYAYKGQSDDDMSFVVGDDIQVSQDTSLNKQDWWWGVNVRTGVSGDFPRSYVGLIADLIVKALYAHKSDQADYLNFEEGAKIMVLTQEDPDWWYGKLENQTGYFPKAYVELPSGK